MVRAGCDGQFTEKCCLADAGLADDHRGALIMPQGCATRCHFAFAASQPHA
jgi:hypothetical protein